MAKSSSNPDDVPAVDAAAPADPAPAPAGPLVAPADESPKRFLVTYGEDSREVVARDAVEAWAVFCDSIRSWPGAHPPGGKSVEYVGQAS